MYYPPIKPTPRRAGSRLFPVLGILSFVPFLGTTTLPGGVGAAPAHAAVMASPKDDDDRGLNAVKRSAIIDLALPDKAMRFTGKKEVGQFAEALKSIAKRNNAQIGEVEVLVWTPGGEAPKTGLAGKLKDAGYGYTAQPSIKMDDGKLTPFAAIQQEKSEANTKQEKRNLVGLWVDQDGTTLLAWTIVRAANAPSDKTEEPATEASIKETPVKETAKEAPTKASSSEEPIVLNADAKAYTVNVMGKTMPKIPSFPALTKKPGIVRGYVYDTKGNPVKGARLGVRSTVAGGFYSGAQGKTDEKGYYEIEPPVGAAHFYCAGASIDYGEGRAAMGLHPADGEIDGFATPNGVVKNFVLLPYGIADRDGIQENPRYCNNYYGGNVVLGWYVNTDSVLSNDSELPNGAEIEFTLTPEGPLVDGSRAHTIIIRKAIQSSASNQLYVNNIPVTTYKISARLVGGEKLHLKETGPYANNEFGLSPKEAQGSTSLTFRPNNAKAEMALGGHGNWGQISISLSRAK